MHGTSHIKTRKPKRHRRRAPKNGPGIYEQGLVSGKPRFGTTRLGYLFQRTCPAGLKKGQYPGWKWIPVSMRQEAAERPNEPEGLLRYYAGKRKRAEKKRSQQRAGWGMSQGVKWGRNFKRFRAQMNHEGRKA